MASADFRKRYIESLVSEIRSYKSRGIGVDTVFFGGGTPSLLLPRELHLIMDAVDESFGIRRNSEFTVEVNPATLIEETLVAFLECGANRFSIGLQSIHENELKKLGRIHDYKDFLATYKMLRHHGVSNISVDLMLGIPEQTPESLGETLSSVISLEPEHISAYGLIIEEGTPFFRSRDTLALPDEDAERQMYFSASELLCGAGYEHYEISNFAGRGFRCRHNLKYWRCEEYIGVGLAAHSYLDGVRFGNSRNAREYFKRENKEIVRLSDADKSFEFVMLALRLKDGFSFGEYEKLFGESFFDGRKEKIDLFEKNGYLKADGGRLRLTEKGFYVSNTVITELLA